MSHLWILEAMFGGIVDTNLENEEIVRYTLEKYNISWKYRFKYVKVKSFEAAHVNLNYGLKNSLIHQTEQNFGNYYQSFVSTILFTSLSSNKLRSC